MACSLWYDRIVLDEEVFPLFILARTLHLHLVNCMNCQELRTNVHTSMNNPCAKFTVNES